ncbi:HEAT repeat domain-containing protein [Chitinimonas taiwanensis]|uniref:HEAT repeat domain-containing protein n=1 Tax=Chitinimonas taiwanensis TaxID=240412 RepID=UPI0035AFBC5F
MTIFGELFLVNLLSYMISLAAGERSAAFAQARANKLRQALDEKEELRKALATNVSILDEVRGTCQALAQDRKIIGVQDHEVSLWQLLSDSTFQADLAEWLMTGAIEEGNSVKKRLLEKMESALLSRGATSDEISHFTTSYFESVDKAIYSHPILAHWRQQLSLEYLKGQVTALRELAEKAAGVYPLAKQEEALYRYCEKALASWDIIDLSNLPEGDVQISTQQLLLRQLYMPLRIEVETTRQGEREDHLLLRLEERREARRSREAGRLVSDDVVPESENYSAHTRSPIGECLEVFRRLVILGDPGGGKTTMLRWMATSYLLKHKGGNDFDQVPDTDTLPDQPWIPVLIRCRELGEVDLCRSFIDFLTQHLNKTELLPEDAHIMRAVILDRIAKGQILLLVDGLDEITNPQVRMQFCQELERTAARYPNAPIVVTSRIVGYRDMPYRMGSNFAHGVIAELTREDKDNFAQRWIAVTEHHHAPQEKSKRTQELIQALHSSDRIERLTGNPMLLTTLALVKRKVGKLPTRRTKLYAEAVSVLLNWNPGLYQTIEEDEAIPQLEYLAYEMCRRGVQQLTDDEILDLLDNLRAEYPRIRAVRTRQPQEFLRHLEQRSSILIRAGSSWQKDSLSEKPVWEFRHLTFQEYLAARALLDGRYPARGKPKSLAEEIGPLAGAMESTNSNGGTEVNEYDEVDVPESWREALRLLVADCKDDDVDDVLLAILNPMTGEDSEKTGRPRAVLAALCLADEPNVSEETAEHVLKTLAAKTMQQDGRTDSASTSLDRAAIEVATSMWASKLKIALVNEFCWRTSEDRLAPGGLVGTIEAHRRAGDTVDSAKYYSELVQCLKSGDRVGVISTMLVMMSAAFRSQLQLVSGLSESLLDIAAKDDLPARHAAAWTLGWMSERYVRDASWDHSSWHARGSELDQVVAVFDATPSEEISTRRWLAKILGNSDDARALPALVRGLNDQEPKVRSVFINALKYLGNSQAVEPLLAHLNDRDPSTRAAIIDALERLADKRAVGPLIAKLDDPHGAVKIKAVEALGRLGDIRAVDPLLAELDNNNAIVRVKVVVALGQLGDKRALEPLLAKLDDEDVDIRAYAAMSIGKLDAHKGIAALNRLLESESQETQESAVGVYARSRDGIDRQLLSSDFDGIRPWIPPQSLLSNSRAANAARKLNIPLEQVRSRIENIATDWNFKLDWKS